MITFTKRVFLISVLFYVSCNCGDKRSNPCKGKYETILNGRYSFYVDEIKSGNCDTAGECGLKQNFRSISEQKIRLEYTVWKVDGSIRDVHFRKNLEMSKDDIEYVACEKQCNTNMLYEIEITSMEKYLGCF